MGSYMQVGHFSHEKGKNKGRKMRWNKVWGEGKREEINRGKSWSGEEENDEVLFGRHHGTQKNRQMFPFTLEGGWRLQWRSERVTLGNAMWVKTIRSPSEHLSSKTHPGSHPSSDIPALCGFGQGGFPTPHLFPHPENRLTAVPTM